MRLIRTTALQGTRYLETLNQGRWLQLESQVRYLGKEASFWFLVAGPECVPELVASVRRSWGLRLGEFGVFNSPPLLVLQALQRVNGETLRAGKRLRAMPIGQQLAMASPTP